MKVLLEQGVDPNFTGRSETPIHGLQKGHQGVGRATVENGVDVKSKDGPLGQTPLSIAAGRGHEAVVELLLECGADSESRGVYEQTPLLWAAWKGHSMVVKLLGKCVDPDPKS
ncbi:hypothetical protein ASPWEDRAFT_44679 [Aspergillus wentii DTO 134E9]|uniref:Uncharacterized protein n=1 Tax=Aspergillus wentii DTO 134E9 TaxID=1073089 RepID=A0A1L9RC95_ASPWE|nr:uncharacterized protein ASPWEDRAFT_44679 [Aspergillus wentii DTO 134E9]OJJ32532.1 hypothetical protein ASPWEDRAFT_44679 [Aspergillus wentii DTO 134E9]